MKKIICIVMVLSTFLFLMGAGYTSGTAIGKSVSYDPEVDYMACMISCAERDLMTSGAAYERQRNAKISGEGLLDLYSVTNFFTTCSTGAEVLAAIDDYNVNGYHIEIKYPEPEMHMTSLGYHTVTGYVATGNPCASGTYPYVGCCACNGLPFGTTIYVSGLGYYIVEDRGGMGDGYSVDIFCETVSECYALTGTYEIFVVEYIY